MLDLMSRKPRNARTDRLTDWRFFYHIYLVSYIGRRSTTVSIDENLSSWV